MRTKWRPEDACFLLNDTAALGTMGTRKGEWLGVYQDPGGKLLCHSRSLKVLCRKLRQCGGVTWPVFVRRAKSKEELLHPASPPYNHFLWLQQRAFEAVALARQRANPNYILHPTDPEEKQAGIEQAGDFLRDLGNKARCKGSKRGDRTTKDEVRRMLRVFDALAKTNGNEPLKSIADAESGAPTFEGRARSLSTQVGRFARRVAKSVNDTYGPGMMSLSYAQLFHAVRGLPGLDRKQDRRALIEAARRGLPRVRLG
jgi:hypothetical protein